LSTQQKYQHIVYEQLRFKISLWNTAFEKLIQSRKNEKNEIKKQLEEKIHVQNNHLEQQLFERQVVPHAIAQARDILEKKFSSESAGKKYLKPILTQIKKGAN